MLSKRSKLLNLRGATAGLVIALVIVGFSWKSDGKPTSFSGRAESISIRKQAGKVEIHLENGVRLASAQGVTLTAGAGLVVLGVDEFPPLSEDVEKVDYFKGQLPSLPEIRFSRQNVRILRLERHFRLTSKELVITGGTVETRDGGVTWQAQGTIRARTTYAPFTEVACKTVIYDRKASTILTRNELTASRLMEGLDRASLRASQITFDLQSHKLLLRGKAKLSFADYALESSTITIDLINRQVSADSACKLTSRGATLEASDLIISLQGGKTEIKARGLKGKVRID